MTRLNGFNRIAWVYDPLKRLVFGSALNRSQMHFISSVRTRTTVLVVGGGTGEILSPLVQENTVRRIFYVEASSEMLALARARVRGRDAGITFIHGTIESLPPGLTFDAIITNFILDLFADAEVARLCEKLESALEDGGIWLVSDFVKDGSWWQRALLRAMYMFFNLTADVQARTLPAWEAHLRHTGVMEVASARYYGGFIKTSVYRKPG